MFVIYLALAAATLIFLLLTICDLKRIYYLLITLPRDLRLIYLSVRIKRDLSSMKKSNDSPARLLDQQSTLKPEATCFVFKGRDWTYQEVRDYTWRVARTFAKRGYKKGDVVALMCSNRPEFVGIWMGLSRLGVVSALINTNLRRDPLRHSLGVAKPRGVIVSRDLCSAIDEIRDAIDFQCEYLQLNGLDQKDAAPMIGYAHLDDALDQEGFAPMSQLADPDYSDPLMYIYTSGTTGLPKAAVIKNSRFLYTCVIAKYLLSIDETDRIYTPLPLYHTAGGMLGIGLSACMGSSCVIRSKFSASNYWKDCAEYKCTVGQYIGEMCRYLLALEPGQWDRKHHVRSMVGNGLRPELWQQFVDRFNISCVNEIYGATEGNANIANIDGTIGAVGFFPLCFPASKFPISLARVNPDTGEIIRVDGYAQRCKPGEAGTLVGRIIEGDATREYQGYLDQTASNKKVECDLFEPGDQYFLTGDILVMDDKGYLYFKDRTGDTFRWKGENVSTAEVEGALNSALGLRDICVFGVQVPNTEGKAGMAVVLDTENNLEVDKLAEKFEHVLPTYAQPIFVRVTQKLDLTGTFKIRKVDVQKEGYDINKVQDKIYILLNRNYEELTRELYSDLMQGKLKM